MRKDRNAPRAHAGSPCTRIVRTPRLRPVARLVSWCAVASGFALLAGVTSAQGTDGSIRGVVYDRDFEVPLPTVRVTILETNQSAESADQGNFLIELVAPGTYTLVFSRTGYVREVRASVVVTPGRLSDVGIVRLSAEFQDLDEYVVQDVLRLGSGSEAGLLELRFESASLMDSISADLMSKAGASDAAGALRLVAGATVQDGKFAVVRGLPDRYVSSQLNGVRLPSADEDTRAVELDQFPSAIIESVQVQKTFTPDQQGDASGGAVNVGLKGIPDESIFSFSAQLGYNSQAGGRDDFLSYEGGGVDVLGRDDGGRDAQTPGMPWQGAAGVSSVDAPIDSKWNAAFGGVREFSDGVRVGAFASLFYERDSAYYDNGRNDSYWVDSPGAGLTPETVQGVPQPAANPPGAGGDFKTALFDITKASQSVQWGGLVALGLEIDEHEFGLRYLHTRSTEDSATLAIDTRGKAYFFPGYSPDDPMASGNKQGDTDAAPYLRTDSLEYSERTVGSLQLDGSHPLPLGDWSLAGLDFSDPGVDWIVSRSSAKQLQPDKRQFGALWVPPSFVPGSPPFTSDTVGPATWYPYKPGANFTLGNFQRVFKEISEESTQYAIDVDLPFATPGGNDGFVKTGLFHDSVEREFDQDTYDNFADNTSYVGDFDDPWSAVFPDEPDHAIQASSIDVDYTGTQEIAAWYAMIDFPLTSRVNLVAGARFESTDIGIENVGEANALWYPPGSNIPTALAPGAADVDYSRDDVLPSIGLIAEATDEITFRAAYSETVARQTFKELTPIIQQEFLGGPIFIGNPDLEMSQLENLDLRVDYRPNPGGLLSVSWFRKKITDPIEFVQRFATLSFTTAENYPEGELTGWEFEARQDVSEWVDAAEGLAVGANATFIESVVRLTDAESSSFDAPGVLAPISERDATNAPEHLYNLYLTYDVERTGTQFGLFYTVRGDTLVAGAGVSDGNFVPSIYATEFDTLNLGVTQKLGDHLKLKFQAKNLTDPEIEEVYRSKYTGTDVLHTSYTKGIDYSISLSFTL